MNYFVRDEEGKLIRCFQHKSEAKRFLQEGWTINYVPPISNYEKAITLGSSLI